MQELNMSKNCIFVEKLYGLCDISYFLFNRRKNGNFRQSNFRRFGFEEVTTLKLFKKSNRLPYVNCFQTFVFVFKILLASVNHCRMQIMKILAS